MAQSASRLHSAVDADFDLASLLKRSRGLATVPQRGTSRVRVPRRTGGSHRDDELALTGQLGEAFVYTQLKARVPDFDSACWVSTNRCKYLGGTGDDSVGADFVYLDVDGRIAQGRAGQMTRCFIEVKSTSSSNMSSFEMSINEWERALECARSEGDLYIVIMVVDVRGQPKVVDAIHDLVAELRSGRLGRTESSFRFFVGEPQPD